MSEYDYDLLVIGAGSGGVRLSRVASSLGARVAVAEDRYMGGTCVNVGCVPKKLFVYASHVREELEDGAGFGWDHSGSLHFDWARLRENKNSEITRLNGIYDRLLENSGATVLNGRAVLTGPNSCEINGEKISARYITIATGGWPFVPDIDGKEHIITSNEFFFMDSFPARAMVWGGGYIAVEFAGILNGLGAETELVYRGKQFLRGFDQDIRDFAETEIRKKGVQVSFEQNIARVEKLASGELKVSMTDGTSKIVDTIICATGRVPNTANLGLEQAGVELGSGGEIVVNGDYQSSVPSIYAIGDVIGGVQLTPVALAEGMALAHNLFGAANPPRRVDYDNIPTAVFCQPNIGTVGLTEVEAREQYGRIQIFRSDFKPMKHTLSGRDERTLMKLIVASDTDRVVGIHMVGPDAGEIIQGLAVAVKAGATKAMFDSTIGIHPTAAEEFVTMREAVRE